MCPPTPCRFVPAASVLDCFAYYDTSLALTALWTIYAVALLVVGIARRWRVVSPYLLSGLARCGRCGKALIAADAKSELFCYYVCSTLVRQGAGSCDARYLNAKSFEEMVINKIKERILTEENLCELVRLVNEEMDVQTNEYRERLDSIVQEMAITSQRLDRLYDALETGKLSVEDLSPRIQQLR